jgi:hypothetical protein
VSSRCVSINGAGVSGASMVKRTSEKAEKVVTVRDANGTAAAIAERGCVSIRSSGRMRGGEGELDQVVGVGATNQKG